MTEEAKVDDNLHHLLGTLLKHLLWHFNSLYDILITSCWANMISRHWRCVVQSCVDKETSTVNVFLPALVCCLEWLCLFNTGSVVRRHGFGRFFSVTQSKDGCEQRRRDTETQSGVAMKLTVNQLKERLTLVQKPTEQRPKLSFFFFFLLDIVWVLLNAKVAIYVPSHHYVKFLSFMNIITIIMVQVCQ